MSSYHINDLDNYPRTYSFLPNQEKDENGKFLCFVCFGIFFFGIFGNFRISNFFKNFPKIFCSNLSKMFSSCPPLSSSVLDHFPSVCVFEIGEHLMTQSLVVQAPYRRIRHPELTPVILNRDREDRNYGKILFF